MKKVTFSDYKEYKKTQIEKSSRQLYDAEGKQIHWITQKEAERVAEHFKQNSLEANFGICHGSKIGFEVSLFRALLGFNIIGTDIGEFAENKPYMLRHDFHEVNADWLRSVDFIYSNSLDHSYDPRKALFAWSECLHESGVMYIEWSPFHLEAHGADCFGATADEYKNLINETGLSISEVIDIPEDKSEFYSVERTIFACQRKSDVP